MSVAGKSVKERNGLLVMVMKGVVHSIAFGNGNQNTNLVFPKVSMWISLVMGALLI
jgi:hypothetical protein